MNKDYIKHLVQCKCILPQFRKVQDPPLHKLIVFSEIDEFGMLIPSFAQCFNCGIVHKVVEVGISEIMKKETLPSILTVAEIKNNLPEKLIELLSQYELDIATWQEIKWILDNEAWGRSIILIKEKLDGMIIGKSLQIIGTSFWRINSFSGEDISEVKL